MINDILSKEHPDFADKKAIATKLFELYGIEKGVEIALWERAKAVHASDVEVSQSRLAEWVELTRIEYMKRKTKEVEGQTTLVENKPSTTDWDHEVEKALKVEKPEDEHMCVFFNWATLKHDISNLKALNLWRETDNGSGMVTQARLAKYKELLECEVNGKKSEKSKPVAVADTPTTGSASVSTTQSEDTSTAKETTTVPVASADHSDAANTIPVTTVGDASASQPATKSFLTEAQIDWLSEQSADYCEFFAALDRESQVAQIVIDMQIDADDKKVDQALDVLYPPAEQTNIAKNDGHFVDPETGEVDLPGVLVSLGWPEYPELPIAPSEEEVHAIWGKANQVADIIATCQEKAGRLKRQADKRIKKQTERAKFYTGFAEPLFRWLAEKTLPRIQAGENAGKKREKTLVLDTADIAFRVRKAGWEISDEKALKRSIEALPRKAQEAIDGVSFKLNVGAKVKEFVEKYGVDVQMTVDGEELLIHLDGLEYLEEQEMGSFTVVAKSVDVEEEVEQCA